MIPIIRLNIDNHHHCFVVSNGPHCSLGTRNDANRRCLPVMTLVWSALSLAGLYAIVAALFNIGVAQSGRFNFAAPQTVMLGSFIAFQVTVVADMPFWAATIIAIVVGAVVGYLVELLAIRFVPATGHQTMVTTVGAAFLIEGIAFVIWGADAQTVPFVLGDQAIWLLGGAVTSVDLVLIATGIVLILGLHLASRHTRWGLAGRAATADPGAAALRGVDVVGNRAMAFALVGALGACTGVLAASKLHASYDMGVVLLVYGFVALTLGGTGSYIGCLIGGVVVATVQVASGRLLGGNYGLLLIFVLLILVLLVRPTGILGRRGVRTI